ncbi:MAG: hypothetical protein SFU91_10010 [Chloroherpetonaceae bacterium]|nr:hypothetical protein [Chloroherpetonaceae bacterium]
MKRVLFISFILFFVVCGEVAYTQTIQEGQEVSGAVTTSAQNDRFYFYDLLSKQKFLSSLSASIQTISETVNKKGLEPKSSSSYLTVDDFILNRAKRKNEIDSLIELNNLTVNQLEKSKSEIEQILTLESLNSSTTAKSKNLKKRLEAIEKQVLSLKNQVAGLKSEQDSLFSATSNFVPFQERYRDRWRKRLNKAAETPKPLPDIEQEVKSFSETQSDFRAITNTAQNRGVSLESINSEVSTLESEIEANASLSQEILALLSRLKKGKESAELDIARLKFKRSPQLGRRESLLAEGEEPFQKLIRDYVNDFGAAQKISTADFGYENGPKGSYHNFQSKEDYDRFLEYAKFYNEANLLRSARRAILFKGSTDLMFDLLSIELASATKTYIEGDFLTSRLLFSDIYNEYSTVFVDRPDNADSTVSQSTGLRLDDVLFYLAESNFGARFYTEARKNYELLINEYPESEYASKSVYRILFTDYVLDEFEKFEQDLDAYLITPSFVENIKVSNQFLKQIRNSLTELEAQKFNLEYELSSLSTLKDELVESLAESPSNTTFTSQIQSDIDLAEVESKSVQEKITLLRVRIDSVRKYIGRQRSQLNSSIRATVPENYLNDYGRIFLLTSMAFYRDKQYQKALDYLDLIFEESSVRKEAEYVSGLIYLALNDNDQAKRYFFRTIERVGDFPETKGKSKTYQMSDIDDAVLLNSTYLQLANIHYSVGTKLTQKIDDLSTLSGASQLVADSLLQLQFVRMTQGSQFIEYQNQIRRILNRISVQDTLLKNLSEQMDKELQANAESEGFVSEYLQNLNEANGVIDEESSKVEELYSNLQENKDDGKDVSRSIRKIRELLERTREKLVNAKTGLYKKIASAEFLKAETYFGKVASRYQDKDLAELGRIWSTFRVGDYKSAQKDLENYLVRYQESNKVYQASFLAGYIKQSIRPNDPAVTLPDYSFVFNGSLVYKYIERLMAIKTQLLQSRSQMNSVYLNASTVEQKQSLEKLINAVGIIISSIKTDPVSFENKNTSLISVNDLSQIESAENVIRAEIANQPNGSDLSIYVNDVQTSVQKLKQLNVETFRDTDNLFQMYSPIAMDAQKHSYQQYGDYYKKLMKTEYESALKHYKEVHSQPVDKDSRGELLSAYKKNIASVVLDRSIVLNSILFEREFFGTQTSELAGTTAIYALSSVTYSEIKRQQEQMKNYTSVLSTFRSAIKRKLNQMEDFGEQKQIEELPDFIQAESLYEPKQKVFEEIIGDFRKAFFIGTEDLKLSKKTTSKKVEVP